MYLAPPAHIHFALAINFEQFAFEVTCKERTKIHEAILQAVSLRLRSESIDYGLVRLSLTLLAQVLIGRRGCWLPTPTSNLGRVPSVHDF